MLPTKVWYGIPNLRASVRSCARTAPSRRMLTGTLAAPGSVFTLPARFLSFLRSYSFFMSFRLLGCRLPSRNDSDDLAPVSFTKDDQQDPLFTRMPNADESILVRTMVWIVEFGRKRVCPDGLGLFEPEAMPFKV